MDIQAVNSAGNPTVRPPKAQTSSSSSGSKAVPTSETEGDSVTLSTKAQALVESNKGGQTSSNSEQRKFSVTDDNDVVLQVIDPKTQKVVKSVPSEEQMQLKNAVREGISDITE